MRITTFIKITYITLLIVIPHHTTYTTVFFSKGHLLFAQSGIFTVGQDIT